MSEDSEDGAAGTHDVTHTETTTNISKGFTGQGHPGAIYMKSWGRA